jgi:hypothetical protein
MKPFLLLFCLWLPATALFAQKDSLFVDQLPFAQIQGSLIEVTLNERHSEPCRGGVTAKIDYGQDCGGGLNRCWDLRNIYGERHCFDTRMQALNWFEAQGWQLVGISSHDEFRIEDFFYFRRKE